MKKFKHAQDGTLVIGVTWKQLSNLDQIEYWPDLMKLPLMSTQFQELDFDKAIKEDKQFIRKNIQDSKWDNSNVKKTFSFNKPKKGESSLILTSRLQIPITGYKFVDEETTAQTIDEIDDNFTPLSIS